MKPRALTVLNLSMKSDNFSTGSEPFLIIVPQREVVGVYSGRLMASSITGSSASFTAMASGAPELHGKALCLAGLDVFDVKPIIPTVSGYVTRGIAVP